MTNKHDFDEIKRLKFTAEEEERYKYFRNKISAPYLKFWQAESNHRTIEGFVTPWPAGYVFKGEYGFFRTGSYKDYRSGKAGIIDGKGER